MTAIYIIGGIFLTLFVIYPFLAFVIAPFIIPNLRRIKYEEIPPDLQIKVDRIVKESTNKKNVLKKIFKLVANHCGSDTMLQFKSPGKLFLTSVNRVWKIKGAHLCNVQNMVLANMLVASGLFSKSDIKLKTTHIAINLHKYLEVKVDNEKINLDPWGHCYGAQFGQYIHGIMPKLIKREVNYD